jgi:hypothetical protein
VWIRLRRQERLLLLCSLMSVTRLCGASHISRGIMDELWDHLACTCKSSRSDIAVTLYEAENACTRRHVIGKRHTYMYTCMQRHVIGSSRLRLDRHRKIASGSSDRTMLFVVAEQRCRVRCTVVARRLMLIIACSGKCGDHIFAASAVCTSFLHLSHDYHR